METDRQLADAFFEHHPTEAARAMETAPPVEIGALLSELDSVRVAPVITAMEPAAAAAALATIDPPAAARIVDAMPGRAASVLLRRAAPAARSEILERLSSRTAKRLARLLEYPEGSAGALLDPSVLTAPPDLTVQETLDRLRTTGGEAYFYLYVVDRRGILIGVVTLRELLVAAPDAVIGAITKRQVATLAATAGRDAIVTHPAWREFRALPVVDREGHFLGMVRHATVHELESGATARTLGPALTGVALDIGELLWTEGAALAGEVFEAVDDPQLAALGPGTVAG